ASTVWAAPRSLANSANSAQGSARASISSTICSPTAPVAPTTAIFSSRPLAAGISAFRAFELFAHQPAHRLASKNPGARTACKIARAISFVQYALDRLLDHLGLGAHPKRMFKQHSGGQDSGEWIRLVPPRDV